MSKKKFKDTGVGKFLLQKIPKVVGAIAQDTPVSNVIEAIIGGSDMSQEDKEIALEKLRLERAEMDGVTRRWVADARSGTWLASNVRPLTLIFLTGVFVILSVFDGNMGEFTIGDAYVPVYQTLLMTVYAAYFAGRSIEKVKKVTK